MFMLYLSAAVLIIVGAVMVVTGQTLVGGVLVVSGIAMAVLGVLLRPLMRSSRAIAEQGGMEVSRLTGAPKMRSSFARANEQMATARQQMAAFSGIGGGVLQHSGSPGSATVMAASDTGTRQNYNPVYEVTLRIVPDGGRVYDATLRTEVNSLAIAQCVPGTTVPVRIDPADPKQVWVDWLAVADVKS